MMLQVDGLGLKRGGRWLFRELSLEAEAGCVTVVMGPNGAGKSSLLFALAGLLPADTGSIRVNGRDLIDCPRTEVARLVAWQGDFPPAEFGLTVSARLSLAAPASLVNGKERLDVVCREMELEGLLEMPLGTLSSGERQRVELAALMLRESPLWLLDEPAAHLDLRHQAAALAMLRREAGQGRTIVVVLHDIQQAASIADRVVLFGSDGHFHIGKSGDMLHPKVLESVFGLVLDRLEGANGEYHIVPRYRG